MLRLHMPRKFQNCEKGPALGLSRHGKHIAIKGLAIANASDRDSHVLFSDHRVAQY